MYEINDCLLDTTSFDRTYICQSQCADSTTLSEDDPPRGFHDEEADEADEVNEADENDLNESNVTNLAASNPELQKLLNDIATKEKWMAEAEAQQQKIVELANQFEAKLAESQSQIQQTESERDALLVRRINK